ncbi:sensor histidine kinase [Ferviditalea candida]|uniref:histidine kinase n=1 Tax=Ferviditalea candida TaxID=3108399 RepID=A0ABU5ZI56_9BACL|nr:ATP-binding protein [Paenibacillaceae bacterium T2]
MFKKTRNRLTLFFAGIMIVFMIVFNGISYLILSSIIYSEREKEIQFLAEMQVEEHTRELIAANPQASRNVDRKNEGHDEENKEHEDSGQGREKTPKNKLILRPFYYVLDRSGNWVAGEQPSQLNKDRIVQQLKKWIPKSEEVKYLDYRTKSQGEMHLLFAGRPVYVNGNYMGSVYTGADISQQTEIFKKLMMILSVMSGLFFVVSVMLGYAMSGRAMIPIIRSFQRQRQFVADASHELRTPLSVLQSSLEVIEDEERGRMGPFSVQVLDDMKDEVKRMSALVAHMLTLARADAAEIQLQIEEFPLVEELEKLMRRFQPLAAEKEQQLMVEAESNLQVRADRERIRQLLIILIDNAIQYTPEGGSIRVAVQPKGDILTISVSDTGIGIPAEKQKDIFERFYRVDPSRSRSAGNAGLGLSIAKWIAESHGGAIKVESEQGKGSTFIVSLPIHPVSKT